MTRAGTATLCGVLLAAGCGGDDGEKAGPRGLAREASAVVEDLERAIADREYARICSELLSAEVRRQVGAGDCPAMLRRTAAGVERPQIDVRKIEIKGRTAVLEVVTAARGQARVADTIRLVREAGRYRVSSLSG